MNDQVVLLGCYHPSCRGVTPVAIHNTDHAEWTCVACGWYNYHDTAFNRFYALDPNEDAKKDFPNATWSSEAVVAQVESHPAKTRRVVHGVGLVLLIAMFLLLWRNGWVK
jgi:hypothetical protein